MRLLGGGKKAEAMDVFRLNQQQHADEKFWTHLGLARGFTELGDKKSAIDNWEIAVKNVPAALSSYTPRFTETLKKLKEGG
jgi:hypothetical protein